MNRKALVSVAAVFVLGALIGGLGVYAWTSQASGNTKRESYLSRLTGVLDLTPDQQQRVQAILADTKSQFDATYDTVRPQMDTIRQQGRQNIRALLTPEQLSKFEDYLRTLDEERKRKGR